MLTQEWIRKAPKVELHCHLDGSISPEALEKIIRRQGGELPEREAQRLGKIRAPKICDSLERYLRPFPYLVSWLQTGEALEAAAYDVLAQGAKENTIYMEMRFAPMLHVEKGLSCTEAVQAVLDGMSRGEREFGIRWGLILCLMRGAEEQKNRETLQTALSFRAKGVVGVDLAGSEAKYPPQQYRDLFRTAYDSGLPITIHAGENGPAEHVRTAIDLGARRIGHGLAIRSDPEIRGLCREKNVMLELCPVSNLQTKAAASIEEYPFPLFLKEGLAVSINTDNRTVSATSLVREYRLLSGTFPVTWAQMEQIALRSLEHSFLPQRTKNELEEQVRKTYGKWKPEGTP